jgi:hypothetical protein
MNGYSNQLNKYEEIRKIKIERKKSVNWIKIVVLILQIQNIKTQMYHICHFVAFSFYSEIIENPDNLLTHLLLICFRPSKFE